MEDEFAETSREEGMSDLEKNQMLIAESENSVMNCPPPALAKAAPYESVEGFSTTQPSLELDS